MKFPVWRERAGVISPHPVWCCYAQGYLYIADTFYGLVKQIVTEWKRDKHLVG